MKNAVLTRSLQTKQIVGVHLDNTGEEDERTYLQPIVIDNETAAKLEADDGDNSVAIVKQYLATG